MPFRGVGASPGEEAVAAVAATGCSSAEAQPKTVGGGDLPGAVPLGAIGTAIGDLVNGDRKRPAVQMEAPPASVVPDSARPIGDAATTTSTSAPTVASVSAAAPAVGIRDHQSHLPSRTAGSIRRGPPKKRICSDLASAAEISASPSASAPSAEAVAAAASAHGVSLSNSGATGNYLVNSTLGATALPSVQGIQQQSSLQLAPSSIAEATMNYWASGRLDSLGSPSILTAENAIAGVPLPISSFTTSLAPHLLLLQRERQRMGHPANIHDNNMLGMSAVRGLSTAAVLAEIEAQELALARARAHQDVVSAALLDYYARPLSYQEQVGLVGVLPAEAQTEVATRDPRTDAPATTVSQEQTLAKTPSTDLHNESVKPAKSRCDGPSHPIGGETSDAQAMLLGKAESIVADKPPPATVSREKVPAKKKTKKKTGGSGTAGAVAPVPKHAPMDMQRPRIAATLSIFPETNTNSMLLSHPEDGDLLSPYLCIIRKQIELFVSTPKDIEAKLAVGGNKVPPQAGQIGLRCIHCKHVPFRDRAKSSESYPNLLKNIHQSVRNYQRHHWPKCKEIPDTVRKDVDACLREKVSKSKGNAGQWWIRSCRDRGLFDAEEVEFLDESKKSGIYLVDVDTNVVREPQKSPTGGEGKTTAKQRSRSPMSISTPSASSKRSGLDVLLAATGIADTRRADVVSTVSVPTAAPHTKSDDVRTIQSSSNVDNVTVPSATPSTGVAESTRHECTQPTCRPTRPS